MGNRNRNITKLEMLIAISMSQYYQRTHVHFIPPRTNFTKMLTVLRSGKFIKPLGLSYYEVTGKGRNYLLRHDMDLHVKADAEVDKFITELGNNNCFGE